MPSRKYKISAAERARRVKRANSMPRYSSGPKKGKFKKMTRKSRKGSRKSRK